MEIQQPISEVNQVSLTAEPVPEKKLTVKHILGIVVAIPSFLVILIIAPLLSLFQPKRVMIGKESLK